MLPVAVGRGQAGWSGVVCLSPPPSSHHTTTPHHPGTTMSTTCQRGKHTTAFVLLSLLAEASLASTVHGKSRVAPTATAAPVVLPCEDPVLITQFTDSSEFVSNAPLTLGGDGFIMEADVRVDKVAWMGRVFEFSNGMEKNNVILTINAEGQWGYHVWQGTQHIIFVDPVPGPCCGVFMHMVLVVTATSHVTGFAQLFIDGVERVSASGPLPVLDTRTDNHIYTSTFPGDVPLDGVVANFSFSTCRAKTQATAPVVLPCEDPVLITQFTDSSEFVSNAPLTLGGDGFIMEADVRVDKVAWMGRVFEFSNGMEKNNVILTINAEGQWGYHVWQGTQHIIFVDPVPGPCCGVFMHMVLVVTATSHVTGFAQLFIDGVERVSASGPLPVLDTRTDNHIYTSTFPGDVPLDGVVANFSFSTCRDKTQATPIAVPLLVVVLAVVVLAGVLLTHRCWSVRGLRKQLWLNATKESLMMKEVEMT